MKILLLLLCLTAGSAEAKDRYVSVRLYSLHRPASVTLEPADASVFAGDHRLKGTTRITAKGSAVTLEGGLKHGPARTVKISVRGQGLWLSGPGLPRRQYTGELVFSSEKNSLKITNSVPLEIYLAGVVSGEAQDLSHPEAYKAQAVAARSYTLKQMNNHSREGCNLCDSTHCQLYTGTGSVSPKAAAAVAATRGELLLYKGAPAAAFYHSICGGRTETMTYVWPYEHKPYLVSVRDGPPGAPYCSIAPAFKWKTRIYYTGLTRLARALRWIQKDEFADKLRVSAWGVSGRASELELQTQRRRVRVTATDFYHGIGRRAGWRAVRSTYFKLHSGEDYVMLDGVGNGHGVGMCQWGAEGMARKGFKYRDILRHYYTGTETGYD